MALTGKQRTKRYRKAQKQKGIVEIRIWVKKDDAGFIKKLATGFFRDPGQKKIFEAKGRGAPAKLYQIQMAERVARSVGKHPPEHLYKHQLSLSKWIFDRLAARKNKRKKAS